ncbi:LigA [Nocardioidaceae bacterium Broad-1]|nr:LigA [Nocardioidaceae bacterium Broad-1]
MKRTAAKRTPAKKAPAKKPATPAEETVTEDVTTPEASDEGTQPAEQEPTESVETTDAADAPEADAPDVEEPSETGVAGEKAEEGQEAGADEAADEPEQPVAEEGSEKEPEESDDVEPVEPVDFVEPDERAASTTAEDPAAEDVEDADDANEVDEVEGATGDDQAEENAEENAEVAEAEELPTTQKADEPDESDEPEKEPEEEPAPLVGRARLFDALTHFRRGQVAVAVLLCVLGYAAVVQVQTNTEDSTYAGLREQELIDILSGLAGTTQKAQEQIEELEATRDELEDQTLQQQTALQRAEEQVDTLRVIAGTVPVSGPGITIEIDPGADPLRLTALLDLIEELRTSGAEAMEIEGGDGEAVRLVASTSIEVSQPAPGLNVGGELISPPYRLQVIGPPDTLAGAIDFYQGPQDQLEEQGAEVKVESEEKIDIESIHTVSR